MIIFISMLDTADEQEKFMRLYERYKNLMWYAANQILFDSHLAEDAVQDAFLALTRHLDKIDEEKEGQTKKFLVTIVKNKAIDILRKKKGVEEDLTDDVVPADQGEDILTSFISKENLNELAACIRKLDPIYQTVFQYKYLHQLSDREIGELMGIQPKTVNVRVFRARKKLQEILIKEGIIHV